MDWRKFSRRKEKKRIESLDVADKVQQSVISLLNKMPACDMNENKAMMLKLMAPPLRSTVQKSMEMHTIRVLHDPNENQKFLTSPWNHHADCKAYRSPWTNVLVPPPKKTPSSVGPKGEWLTIERKANEYFQHYRTECADDTVSSVYFDVDGDDIKACVLCYQEVKVGECVNWWRIAHVIDISSSSDGIAMYKIKSTASYSANTPTKDPVPASTNVSSSLKKHTQYALPLQDNNIANHILNLGDVVDRIEMRLGDVVDQTFFGRSFVRYMRRPGSQRMKLQLQRDWTRTLLQGDQPETARSTNTDEELAMHITASKKMLTNSEQSLLMLMDELKRVQEADTKRDDEREAKYLARRKNITKEVVNAKIQREKLKIGLIEEYMGNLKHGYPGEDCLTVVKGDARMQVITERIDMLENEHINLKKEYLAVVKQNTQQQQLQKLAELREKLFEFFTPKSLSPVDAILNNPKSAEFQTTTRFVNRFLAVEESPMASAANVRAFIDAMVDHIQNNNPSVPEAEIKLCVENFIFPQIFSHVMKQVSRADEDELFLQQCDKFKHLTQAEMGISIEHRSDELIPYVNAIAKLKSLYFARTPTKKMYAILEAADEVFNVISAKCPDDPVDADHFLDIWIYVVLKSRVTNLLTVLNFLREYGSEDLLQTEPGYYITCTELAAKYICELRAEDLAVDHNSQIVNTHFVVCEKVRFKKWAENDTHIDIISEYTMLKGYKMFAVKEWLWTPARFVSVVLEHTGDPNDEAYVMVLTANDTTSPAQQTFLKEIFFEPTHGHSTPEQIASGTVLVTDVEAMRRDPNITLLPIPAGDFDQYEDELRLMVTFDKFSCFDTDEGPAEEGFRRNYCIPPGVDVHQALPELVREVQVLLRHLNLLPIFAPIDGLYNHLTSAGVKCFQMKHNAEVQNSSTAAQTQAPRLLSTTGYVDPDTLYELRTSFKTARSQLANAGFAFAGDVVENHEDFSNVIQAFQRSVGTFPDGTLGDKTKKKLMEFQAFVESTL
eukprot:GFYU01002342.1.p1 GENE.GFYU01002342.1~~GFYU01002342.1.p1  ORF type:complete len:1008 (-),score=248.86 GFYU01002342.1:83-3106(-)